MTDIERAEEYAETLSKEYKESLVDFHDIFFLKDAIAKSYLEGLNAGGQEKWHDLRKNPKDLPDACMNIVNQDGEKVRYDYVDEVWRTDDVNDYICDTPKAWCEVPTFEE